MISSYPRREVNEISACDKEHLCHTKDFFLKILRANSSAKIIQLLLD
jgi:hypothetical protein